jgi:hypothetical protein
MDDLNYQKFLSWVSNYNFRTDEESYKFANILRKIPVYIPEAEIQIFYPKNLFVGDVETDLLLITNDKIIKITGSETKVFFEVFKLKDVINFNYEITSLNGRENVVLNVFFSHDRHLNFNSLSDTNDHWRYTFVKKIEEIYRMLLSNQ